MILIRCQMIYLLHIKQIMLQLKKFMELTSMGMKKKIVAHLFKLYAEKAKKEITDLKIVILIDELC